MPKRERKKSRRPAEKDYATRGTELQYKEAKKGRSIVKMNIEVRIVYAAVVAPVFRKGWRVVTLQVLSG